MKYIIDRFEGDFAVCETPDGMVNIKKSLIPKNAKEGSALINKDGRFYIAENDSNIQNRIEELQNKLFE